MLRLVLASCLLGLVTPAPQGLLDSLSKLLTSVVGGGATGEVASYESAPYTLIRSYDGYEERSYPRQTWVLHYTVMRSNVQSACKKLRIELYNVCWQVCTRSGRFNSLFSYISGTNSAGSKLEMTVPVMTTESEKRSEMCFFLPASAQVHNTLTSMVMRS